MLKLITKQYFAFLISLGFKVIFNYNIIFVVQRFLGLLLILLLVNNISKDSYGLFVYFISVQYFIVELSHLGLPLMIIKKIASNKIVGGNKVYSIIVFSFLFSFFLSVLLFFIGNNFFFKFPISFLSLSALITLTTLNYIFVAVFTSIKKANFAYFSEAVLKIIIIILWVTFYLLPNNLLDFQSIIYTYIAANIFVFLVFILFFYKDFILKLTFKKFEFEFKEYFYSIFFLGLSSIILLFNTRIDIFMIDYFLGKQQVASYYIATQLSFIPYMAMLSLYTILSSVITRNINKEKYSLIFISMVFYRSFVFLAILLISIFYYFYLKDLILIFFNPLYLNAYNPAMVLCILYLAATPFIFSDLILKLSGNEKKVMYYAATSAILNISLNYFFIIRYGIVGASYATGISMLMMHFLCFLSLNKKNFFLFLLIKFFLSKKKYQINYIVNKFFKA